MRGRDGRRCGGSIGPSLVQSAPALLKGRGPEARANVMLVFHHLYTGVHIAGWTRPLQREARPTPALSLVFNPLMNYTAGAKRLQR